MEVRFMTQHRSRDTMGVLAGRPLAAPGVRLATAFAAVALALAACTGGGSGGSPGASGAAGGDGGGDAGGYPDREITFVVPFSEGGPTDTVTRLIAEPMGEALGQQIVVQNVEGAGGTVAAGQVAQAEPDGYTVLMHHIGMSTAPALYGDELAYDPLEDFEMIGLVTEVPMTIIGASDLEPNTMEEFVQYVTDNADSVTPAHAGIGAASHLCGLLIQDALGVELTFAPYEGTGPAMDDLLGGQVDFMCDQTTNTTSPIQSGDVKAYAVTTPERVESLSDVPTTEEEGFAEIQVGVWHGLYVPAGTPEEVVQRLTEALQEALTDENVIETLAGLGATPVAEDQATPDAHRQRLEEQIELWTPIIEESGAGQ
jgi:tripartite-type tricarboxylate transporter receptor subunit TctC